MQSSMQSVADRARAAATYVSVAVVLIASVVGGVGCGSSIEGSPDGSLEVPERISFRQIKVGGEDIRRFTLRNEASAGAGPVEVKNLQIRQGTDDEIDEFAPVQPNAFPGPDEVIELAPGEEESWEIAYRPENDISDNGAVTFDVENDPSYDDSQVIVPLETREMNPQINYEPGQTLNFDADQGETVRKFVTVSNTGWAPLELDEMRLTGTGMDDFEVSFAKPGEFVCAPSRSNPFVEVAVDLDDDGEDEMAPKRVGNVDAVTPDDPASLWPVDPLAEQFQPSECFVIIVAFEPSDDSATIAELELESNATPATQQISLAGNSEAPCLQVSARDLVDFGVTSVNATTRQTVRLKNCRRRADPLEISDVQVVNASGVFEVEPGTGPSEILDGDASTKVTLEGDEQASFTMSATPDSRGTFGSTDCGSGSGNPAVIINSNDPAYPEKRVCLKVVGDDNACPSAVAQATLAEGSGQPRDELTAKPLDTVKFDGTDSTDPDGSVQRYEWSILEKPQGSTTRLTPTSSAPKPEMKLDIAGNYRVELKVYDDGGTVSCGNQAVVDINAIPEEAIHVQLVWDSPNDPDETDDSGTDLDLHFLNPDPPRGSGDWDWSQAPYDIYYDNKTQDWGEEGVSSDNPSLDIDDTDGAGPENINLNNPPNTGANPYKVGVYYFDDHGYGESYATVRIFIRGSLKKAYKNKFMAGTGVFWHVADISWPSRAITDVDSRYPNGYPN